MTQFINEPNCIVKKALDRLNSIINVKKLSWDPRDIELAKIYFQALTQHVLLNEEEIESYALIKLCWTPQFTKTLIQIVYKLNKGQMVSHESRIQLDAHFLRWQAECNSDSIK
ncbi:MAG: hypothetical protein V4543_13185 [Bacteroidota bacterium]